jgi:hypothetical protein
LAIPAKVLGPAVTDPRHEINRNFGIQVRRSSVDGNPLPWRLGSWYWVLGTGYWVLSTGYSTWYLVLATRTNPAPVFRLSEVARGRCYSEVR